MSGNRLRHKSLSEHLVYWSRYVKLDAFGTWKDSSDDDYTHGPRDPSGTVLQHVSRGILFATTVAYSLTVTLEVRHVAPAAGK